MTIDLANNDVQIHKMRSEPWKVTMLYTGPDTLTAGRIYRAKNYISNEPFMLTYGDGVSDVNIKVPDGKIIGLLGPNGSGKTTIMKAICGFHYPTKGTIKVSGIDVTKEPEKIDAYSGFNKKLI